jgi:hypothetical protein
VSEALLSSSQQVRVAAQVLRRAITPGGFVGQALRVAYPDPAGDELPAPLAELAQRIDGRP